MIEWNERKIDDGWIISAYSPVQYELGSTYARTEIRMAYGNLFASLHDFIGRMEPKLAQRINFFKKSSYLNNKTKITNKTKQNKQLYARIHTEKRAATFAELK